MYAEARAGIVKSKPFGKWVRLTFFDENQRRLPDAVIWVMGARGAIPARLSVP